MATLPSASLTLDQVVTRYAFAKVGTSEYKDQKYKLRPLLMLLNERKKSYDGGAQIVHPVNLGIESNTKSLSRNQKFSITGENNQTWARYQPTVLVSTMFVSWWDVAEARGNKFKMVSIMDSALDDCDESTNDKKAEMLSASTAAETTDITPLLSIVATSGESGGLNPANSGQDQWASQVEDTIAWSTAGIGRSRSGVRKVEDVKGKTDVFVLPDTYWDETCEIGDSMTQYNTGLKTRGGTLIANLGVQVPFILNTPVIHDPAWNSAQTATGMGLDLSGVHLTCDSAWTDHMLPFKEMAHHGQLGQASVKIWKGNLTCSSRRTQLLLSTLS